MTNSTNYRCLIYVDWTVQFWNIPQYIYIYIYLRSFSSNLLLPVIATLLVWNLSSVQFLHFNGQCSRIYAELLILRNSPQLPTLVSFIYFSLVHIQRSRSPNLSRLIWVFINEDVGLLGLLTDLCFNMDPPKPKFSDNRFESPTGSMG